MTVDQEDLLRKAHRSLEAARLLLEHADADFAASRAYYTMFYIAEALLEGEQLSFSSHAAVISAFGKHFAKTERVPRELHKWMIEAQKVRTEGDYNAAASIDEHEALLHIEHAAEFIRAGEKLMGLLPGE